MLSRKKSGGSRGKVYSVCMLKRRRLHAWFIGFFWLLFRVGVKDQSLGTVRDTVDTPGLERAFFWKGFRQTWRAGMVVITTMVDGHRGITDDAGNDPPCAFICNLNLKWKRIPGQLEPDLFFFRRRYRRRMEYESNEVCFELVEMLVHLSLSFAQTNESACGRTGKEKKNTIKLRLNLPPFRSEAAGFSFSLRPFRCRYLLNGRTGINYFPLCWRALDASSKWKSTLVVYFVTSALFFSS